MPDIFIGHPSWFVLKNGINRAGTMVLARVETWTVETCCSSLILSSTDCWSAMPVRKECEGRRRAEGDLMRRGRREIWEDAHGRRQSGLHKKYGPDATEAKIQDRSGGV